jgi:hypothetical protein
LAQAHEKIHSIKTLGHFFGPTKDSIFEIELVYQPSKQPFGFKIVMVVDYEFVNLTLG